MIEIVPIPAFEDNYIWLIRQETSAVAVDPGDAEPLLDYLRNNGLDLAAVLLTHHHGDHCGGVPELKRRFDVPIYGPRHEAIPGITHAVGDGDVVSVLGRGTTFQVLEVPGHTAGHVAYYGINSLFCGDTLFTCGCGRLFEGTPEQMQASLARFAALPDATRVYCAHEYTLENIAFAKLVEPGNVRLVERERRDRLSRERGLPTLPSSIELEKQTNPFLRWQEPDVVAAASRFAGSPLGTPVAVFTAIRQWRDRY